MTNFNSIKVQLELSVPPVKGKYFDFNSIKVQLEHISKLIKSYTFKFQFHKGTIRTCQITNLEVAKLLNFNSIKVQLEHYTFSRFFLENNISIP